MFQECATLTISLSSFFMNSRFESGAVLKVPSKEFTQLSLFLKKGGNVALRWLSGAHSIILSTYIHAPLLFHGMYLFSIFYCVLQNQPAPANTNSFFLFFNLCFLVIYLMLSSGFILPHAPHKERFRCLLWATELVQQRWTSYVDINGLF